MNINNIFHIPQINPLGLFNNPSSPASELQNAIINSDLTALKNLITAHPNLLSQQMPNGETPLNFAVQQKNEPIVQSLLELGSDPSLKDDQHLNAMDYAVLSKDEKIAAQIFHHYVSKDIEDTQNSLQNPGLKKEMTAAITQIYSTINYIRYGNTCPLHIAILQKDKEKVKSLLDDKIQASTLSENGDSILHLAATAGDKEIFNLCLTHLDSKEAIDLKNSQGFTPLHYAASHGHLDIMQMLAKEGANIRLKSNLELTPLMLLCENIEQRDPLRITGLDKFMFLGSLAMWASQFVTLQTLDWKAAFAINLTTLSWSTIATIARETQISSLQTNQEKTARIILSLIIGGISQSILNSDNLFSLGLMAYSASGFAINAFKGLNSCWRNSYRGKAQAVFKAFISYAPDAKNTWDFTSLLLGKLPPEIANINNLYAEWSVSSTHPIRYMDRLSEMSLLCAKDNKSIECQNASDSYGKFIKRILLLDKRFKPCEDALPSAKKKCEAAASLFRSVCSNNPESAACDEAEALWKKTLTIIPLDKCKSAIEKITGSVNSTLKQVVKAYKSIAMSTHPDKGGSNEKYIEFKEAYAISIKCLR